MQKKLVYHHNMIGHEINESWNIMQMMCLIEKYIAENYTRSKNH